MVREIFNAIPDPWQDDVLKSFPTNQRIAMKASKGPGKQLAKSIVIETPTGKKRWGDLKVGDKVWAVDGTPTTVLRIFENGVQQCYKVVFDDGSYTYAGPEHNWSVRGNKERASGSQEFVTLTTQQIIERGVRITNGRWQQRQFEIPIHQPVQYPFKELKIDPYVLGVWLGDGSKNCGAYTGIDDSIKEEILSRGYTFGKEDKLNTVRTILGILGYLKELNISHLGSHERYIPDEYKYGSIQQRKDLLAGLLDTDGCIDKDDGHTEFDSTSKRLAKDVVWLVRSLGGKSFIKDTIKKTWYYDEHRNKVPGRDCYRVSLRLPFNPFKSMKKAVRWRPALKKTQTRYLTRYIDRIELAHYEDCSCIQVDHSQHLYLANDFIVTHNSCIEAWLAWNFLLTRPFPKIAATSISGDNLRDGLWSEMAKWREKSPLLKEAFVWQKERIFSKAYPETWWMSARNWSKSADINSLGNTLAGLHADYIMFILDESGGIPDAIMASAEAALSSCKEGHIIQAGNPTHLEGPLYRACTKEKGLWKVFEITSDPDDPNRSPRVSVQWAKEQIEKYGRDNPWVLVNVFGRFPPHSFNTLIGPDEVKAAIDRRYKQPELVLQPVVLGVDVARYGDDSSIIFPRQGLQAYTPYQYKNLDGTEGAERVISKWREWNADACFIDNTGGFGASWIDNMVRLGKSPIGIHFSQTAIDERYFNKRAEMAFNLVNWIKAGGALPDVPELLSALTQTTYTFKGDKLLLEAKEDVKVKLGHSPDHMDALMLTFAHPVEKQSINNPFNQSTHQIEYNPFSRDKVYSETDQYVYNPRSF
jgi:hypothetical protein